jgi:NADH dehydrogenase
MSDEIVVVGGGFAGFWAAVAARRVGGDRVGITLVSPQPVLQNRPRLYEAHPETLGIPIAPLLASLDVRFTGTSVVEIDVIARRLVLADGDRLDYDRLVVAAGSVMRRPAVPGADEAFSIDNQAEAIAFDERLAKIAYTNPRPSVAVIGAGFTGIELALELRDRIATHGAPDAAADMRIVLVDRVDVVGNDLGPGPRPVIEAALQDARVELRLGADVTGLAADGVTFADGSRLDVEAVVLTTGLVAAPIVAGIPGEHDSGGRVIVDRYLRAPEAPQVFVTGDAAAADTGEGHRTLSSCQHALQLGRFAGENAARDLFGLELRPYAQPRYVTCLDLGRSGAVFTTGWDRVISRTGSDAKTIKRNINTVLIVPPLDGSVEALLRASEPTT